MLDCAQLPATALIWPYLSLRANRPLGPLDRPNRPFHPDLRGRLRHNRHNRCEATAAQRRQSQARRRCVDLVAVWFRHAARGGCGRFRDRAHRQVPRSVLRGGQPLETGHQRRHPQSRLLCEADRRWPARYHRCLQRQAQQRKK